MIITSVALLFVGITLLVRIMIVGVVRRGPQPSRAAANPRLGIVVPTLAAFCTVAGAVGYPLARARVTGLPVSLAVSMGSGAVASTAIAILIFLLWRYAVAQRQPETDDEVQGLIARVTRPASTTRDG